MFNPGDLVRHVSSELWLGEVQRSDHTWTNVCCLITVDGRHWIDQFHKAKSSPLRYRTSEFRLVGKEDAGVTIPDYLFQREDDV